ncbi:hypothetical protein B0J11DRAFT_529874 [Dendryphion nanum]|uniref:Uncharacterized protein n=1 Tax=Dendryphion nanum TaxID=256645 RepID=A0A9P9IKL2_9PLEO|nr:hypothetical protein B0J11DRAFT_529874 [Dendryphion nanum]
MPSLKDLVCSVELAPGRDLKEYMSTYGDGFVETFIAVPDDSKTFAVHLNSTKYISEGLAMYVFIDGIYQCNRNRIGLEDRRKSGKPLDSRTIVDFRVRQKEEKQNDGTMIARGWKFEKLNIGMKPPDR